MIWSDDRSPDTAGAAGEINGGEITVGVIGLGRMAQALVFPLIEAGLLDRQRLRAVVASEASAERLRHSHQLAVSTDPLQAWQAPVVLLAVKPQQLEGVAAALAAAEAPTSPRLLISVLAGVTLARLQRLFPNCLMVRAVPNTPCLVGRGVSVVCRTPEVPAGDLARVLELLAAVGRVHEADETLMDAVTGLSGSGPGFVALLVEALADGGVKAGLPRSLSLALAIETLSGTAALLEQTGEHPAQIKDRVSSPGGTTIAGLAVLEQRGVRGALIDAVVAAAARARELGK